MTKYIELYSKEEKNFLKSQKYLLLKLNQLYKHKPYIITKEIIINDCILVENIIEGCVIYRDQLFYNQNVFDIYIKDSYTYECLKTITSEGKVNFFYKITNSCIILPEYCFYFNIDSLNKNNFLSSTLNFNFKNGEIKCIENINLVSYKYKNFVYSSDSLCLNIISEFDKYCIVTVGEMNLLAFSKREINEYEMEKINYLSTNGCVENQINYTDKTMKIKLTYSNIINLLILLSILTYPMLNFIYSQFIKNLVTYIIFMIVCILILLSTRIKKSMLLNFLDEYNYYSPIKDYYYNKNYENNKDK